MSSQSPLDTSIRLNKAISDTGYCSRREADKLIDQGRVMVNESRGNLGDRVSLIDKLIVDGKLLKRAENTSYIVFNKPVGITCTTEVKIKNNIIPPLPFRINKSN